MLTESWHGTKFHDEWIDELCRTLGGAQFKALVDAISNSTTSHPITYVKRKQAFELPFVITEGCWDEWCRVSIKFIDLIFRFVNENYKENGEEFLGDIGITDKQIALIKADVLPNSSGQLMARPDFFLSSSGPIFLESNIDSSLGGLGTADSLSAIYKHHLTSQKLEQGATLRALPLAPALATHMRSAARRGAEPVRFLIADWRDEIDEVPWPYERLVESLLPYGLIGMLAGEGQVEYRASGLSIANSVVDLVIRGITPISRLWDSPDAWAPLWAAVENGTPMVTSLWSVPYSSKAVLGALWEAVSQDTLTTEDENFVRRHVPWTWRVDQAACKPPRCDSTKSTRDYAMECRNGLVLKSPSDGSCKNVTVGRYASKEEWKAAIDEASQRRGYVLQEYCEPTIMKNVTYADDVVTTSCARTQAGLTSYSCVLSVFVIGRGAAGSCIRGTASGGPYISCMHGAREGVAMINRSPC